jgi:HSP20 family protein
LRRFFDNPERFMPSLRIKPPAQNISWFPRFNSTSNASHIRLIAELPEAERDGLDVSASNGSLVIRGTYDFMQAVERDSYRYSEQGTKSFSRVFPLPENADWEATEANFDEGVLTVTVPLNAVTEPRRIEITAADEQPVSGG